MSLLLRNWELSEWKKSFNDMKMTLKTWKDLEQLKHLNIIWSQGKGEHAEFYLDIYVGGRSFILFLFVETTYLHSSVISVLPWDILSRLFGSNIPFTVWKWFFCH